MQLSVDVSMVLAGMLGGLVAASSGYFKNPKDPQGVRQEFDPRKFFPTAILGILIGGFAGAIGMSYDDALGFLANMGILGGLTALIESVFKAAYRTVKG